MQLGMQVFRLTLYIELGIKLQLETQYPNVGLQILPVMQAQVICEVVAPEELVTLAQLISHRTLVKFQRKSVWQAQPPLVVLSPVEYAKLALVQTPSHRYFAEFQVDLELHMH